MNYCEIKSCDIANGDGVRVSLFVSGCEKHCKGCFNPSTWDPNAGRLFDNEAYALLCTYLKKPYIKGLTLLGGDPFFPGNRVDIVCLLRRLREDIPEFTYRGKTSKNVWMYTGYMFEDLSDYDKHEYCKFGYSIDQGPARYPILPFVDVVVDGPFIEEQKDLTLKFRGSANQRIIDVRKTLLEQKIVLYEFK